MKNYNYILNIKKKQERKEERLLIKIIAIQKNQKHNSEIKFTENKSISKQQDDDKNMKKILRKT